MSKPRAEILSSAARFIDALQIKRAVTVLESALVQVPTAMGWLKPVVLLPAQAMTGLSLAQIDALVAHELAHIKRHDYLVNLLQSAIETLLFYHPAVWLLSRRVRHERELCCDDMAIAVCGDDRITYASALADLESLRQEPQPMLAANGGSLLTRVKRILTPDDVQTVRGRGHWMAGVGILLIALIAVPINVSRARAMADPRMETVEAELGLGAGLKQMLYAQPLSAPAPVGAVDSGDPIMAGDQQKIAVGQIVRLEVTMTLAGSKLTQRQADMMIATAYGDMTKAGAELQRAKAESDRLSKVDLRSEAAALEAAKTVPGLSTDSVVVNYLAQIEDQEVRKRRQKAANGYGNSHPLIIEIDQNIASIQRQLGTRLRSLVDTARLNAETARESAERFTRAYQELSATSSAGAVVRSPELSKDYTVQEDGTILLPYAGNVKAAGLTLVALQESVRLALRAQGQKVVKVLASIEARAADALPKATTQQSTIPQPIPVTSVASSVEDTQARLRGLAGVRTQPVGVVEPVSQPPQQMTGYVIGPNDVVRVNVFAGGQVQADFRQSDYTVQTDGTVSLPLLAPLKVAGLSVKDANVAIQKALIAGFIFDECVVDVVMLGYHSSHLKVQGAVNKPGRVDLTADKMTLTDLLNMAGGLQPSAGTEIRVKRNGGRPSQPDVLVRDGWEVYSRWALDSGALTEVPLYDNDTVDVPVALKFYAQGFVVMPGQYQWEPSLTLERALVKAGGVSKDGGESRIEIRRMDPATKKTQSIKLGADPSQTLVQPGDIILVPKKR